MKITKMRAGYVPFSPGVALTRAARCGSCTMFVAPNRCTLVYGRIDPYGMCVYFERIRNDF